VGVPHARRRAWRLSRHARCAAGGRRAGRDSPAGPFPVRRALEAQRPVRLGQARGGRGEAGRVVASWPAAGSARNLDRGRGAEHPVHRRVRTPRRSGLRVGEHDPPRCPARRVGSGRPRERGASPRRTCPRPQPSVRTAGSAGARSAGTGV
ncbi:MAG: hypothetical protein AVDCRST_MAG19-3836, partial [uncultured Thermomicrobiales bacterium]